MYYEVQDASETIQTILELVEKDINKINEHHEKASIFVESVEDDSKVTLSFKNKVTKEGVDESILEDLEFINDELDDDLFDVEEGCSKKKKCKEGCDKEDDDDDDDDDDNKCKGDKK